MNRLVLVVVSLTIVLLPVVLIYNNPASSPLSSDNPNTISKSSVTTISARIAIAGKGAHKQVIIFGYTSPQAEVSVMGQGVSDNTTARSDGYFSFPATTIYEDTKELCLEAKDTEGRTSQPTCFPIYFSMELYGIGPIILAPTLTVAKNSFAPNEKILLSGQSIPNKYVRIHISSDTTGNNTISMINNNVKTLSSSNIQVLSNSEGYFSVDTSSNTPQTQYVYSAVNYQGKNSPKSTTLAIKIDPWWLVIIKALLKESYKHAIELAVLLEALLGLLYLFYLKKRSHPLAIYKEKLIAKIQNQITPIESHPLMRQDLHYLKQI